MVDSKNGNGSGKLEMESKNGNGAAMVAQACNNCKREWSKRAINASVKARMVEQACNNCKREWCKRAINASVKARMVVQACNNCKREWCEMGGERYELHPSGHQDCFEGRGGWDKKSARVDRRKRSTEFINRYHGKKS